MLQRIAEIIVPFKIQIVFPEKAMPGGFAIRSGCVRIDYLSHRISSYMQIRLRLTRRGVNSFGINCPCQAETHD